MAPRQLLAALRAVGRLELAFVLLTLSTGAVSLLFGTFHVELFRTAYGLDATQFAAGHALYAVWNTANDLCSGAVADRLAARVGGSRVPLVRAAGLLWVTAGFLFPWWRWGALMPLPVQFVVALSLFDGFYSFVAIVEGALLAELAADTAARARIGRLNSLCAIAVFPLVSWLGFACWDPYDLRLFRRLACCVSCVAACGVALGATMMQQHQRLQHERQHGHSGSGVQRGSDEPLVRYGTFPTGSGTHVCHRGVDSCHRNCLAVLGPGVGHRNFLCFCCMDALLEAENIFWNSFRLTFAGALLPLAGWSKGQIASLLSVSQPQASLERASSHAGHLSGRHATAGHAFGTSREPLTLLPGRRLSCTRCDVAGDPDCVTSGSDSALLRCGASWGRARLPRVVRPEDWRVYGCCGGGRDRA
jgi:Na+/melibiose symporter-like transporter